MSAAPNLNHNPQLDAILERVNEVAVLPHAVYKILEISGNGNAAASELERAIVVDPGFSTRLLAHANCAFYGLPKRVTNIKDAIMFLGFKQIRQMAMTVGFFDLFAGKNDKESLRRRTWWRHSIDTAICSKWVAAETKRIPSDEAYTVGLLTSIGKTILDRSQSGAYEKVEPLIAAGMTALSAETSVFGCNHVEVGQGACRKWGLPDPIVLPLDYFTPVEPGDEFAAHIGAVHFGHVAALAAVEGPAGHEVPDWVMDCLHLPPGDRLAWLERAIEYLTTTGRPSM